MGLGGKWVLGCVRWLGRELSWAGLGVSSITLDRGWEGLVGLYWLKRLEGA